MPIPNRYIFHTLEDPPHVRSCLAACHAQDVFVDHKDRILLEASSQCPRLIGGHADGPAGLRVAGGSDLEIVGG